MADFCLVQPIDYCVGGRASQMDFGLATDCTRHSVNPELGSQITMERTSKSHFFSTFSIHILSDCFVFCIRFPTSVLWCRHFNSYSLYSGLERHSWNVYHRCYIIYIYLFSFLSSCSTRSRPTAVKCCWPNPYLAECQLVGLCCRTSPWHAKVATTAATR